MKNKKKEKIELIGNILVGLSFFLGMVVFVGLFVKLLWLIPAFIFKWAVVLVLSMIFSVALAIFFDNQRK